MWLIESLRLTCAFYVLQPLEVLRIGMKREFLVVEDEDDYGIMILSLAATEVSSTSSDFTAKDCVLNSIAFRRRRQFSGSA